MGTATRLVAGLALILSWTTAPSHAQSVDQSFTANVLGGEPDTLDPSRSAFTGEAAVIRQVFEPLLRLDAELKPTAAAAQSYDLSADGRVYTFHLRPDARFSDGVPVTARDFEYSFKRLLDPRTAAPYASFFVDAGVVGAEEWHSGKVATSDGVGVRAVDDLTLEVQLITSFGPFPNLAALWVVPPLRQDIIEANGDSWTLNPETYIGNGPFIMTEWIHQDHISFAPNPNFHGPGPLLQKITFLMVENPLFDYIAYLNDERDSTTVPPAELQAVRENPQMAPELVEYPVLSTNWLALNGARGPLANPQVRKAISKAIDRERLVRDINAGLGRPATSVVPPGMPGHQPGLGSDIDLDVAGARDLLAQAGFPGGAGFPRLSFSYAAGGLQRRAEFIQAQLKDNLGVDIQLNPVEQKAFAALFTEQRYDISLIAWSADYPDPQNWFNGNFGCRTLNNKYSYCNPVFDDLVARADSSVDPDDRLALYSQAQELLIADLPVVPLDHAGGLVLVKPYVRNMVVTALDAYAGDRFLDRVTIDAH